MALRKFALFASTLRRPTMIAGLSRRAGRRGESVALTTSIDIAAEADRVWAVLADFPAYPAWNPFVVSIEGRLKIGALLVVRLALPDRDPMVLRPRLLSVRRHRHLHWAGQVVAPGLFDGEHLTRLEPLAGGGCRLHQEERFTGVLAPMFCPGLIDAARTGFEAMNRALKDRVEATCRP